MGRKKPLLLLLHNGLDLSTTHMKKRLIDEGYFKDKCQMCGWNEKYRKNSKYSGCELHHINGNNTDWRIENLMMLCPNCHSKTDNYKGRNKPYGQSITFWTLLNKGVFKLIANIIFWAVVIIIILAYLAK